MTKYCSQVAGRFACINMELYSLLSGTLCLAAANSSSELAQKLSINNLVNSYTAFNTNYHDTGLFGVYMSVRLFFFSLA